MNLIPLLHAPLAIQIHAFAAMAAFIIGLAQFALPKGTPLHKQIGWLWVGLMVFVAASSFFIHQIRMLGPWSPLHLLSLYTLGSLAYAIYAIRHGNTRGHKIAMISVFFFGLIVAGGFTFLPGRLMHAVVLGG